MEDFLVVDNGSSVGGLSRSFQDPQGFWWDIGGHVQFSHYPYFDDVMLKAIPRDGWWEHNRESWVWLEDRFVPYPFQNNLRYLTRETQWKCVKGLLEAARGPVPMQIQNFGAWIDATFGPGIAEVFMRPYNFKVWATQPEQMSYQWIGDRVSVVDVERALQNIFLEKDDVSWGPNNRFQLSKAWRYGRDLEESGRLIGAGSFRLEKTITRIDSQKRIAECADGTKIQFDVCLSTIPLDHLADLVEGFPEALRKVASELRHSSTNVVGIGIEGPMPEVLKGKCWLYFPENNCPFYRTTVFSHYSRFNVPHPERQWSLMAEVSESDQKLVDGARLISDVIQGLRSTKLLPESAKIVSQWQFRAPYGYPVPNLRRDSILDAVHPELEKRSIFSRGRFGGWKYEVSNQDHSFMQGVEWVNYTIEGTPETTYRYSGSESTPRVRPLLRANSR